MPPEILADIEAEFQKQRGLAERALAQADDAAFFAAPDAETNALAVLVKHVGGNLRSRWTDALTTDGDKPDRDRDGEFEVRPGDTREALMARWAEGWAALDATLGALGPDDLGRTITIRGEPHSVGRALVRSLAHTALHVGQIIQLAKMNAGAGWQTLSIPRGQSETYAADLRARHQPPAP